MQLDRTFVRQLNPPLSDVLPHGAAIKIADAIGKSPLTVRNAINGASTNEQVIEMAITIIMKKVDEMGMVIAQFPSATIDKILEKSN